MDSPDSMEAVKTTGGVGGALLALAMVLQRAFSKRAPVRDAATTEAIKGMTDAIGGLSEKISVLIERLSNQAEHHDDLKEVVHYQGEQLRALELKFERMEALIGTFHK